MRKSLHDGRDPGSEPKPEPPRTTRPIVLDGVTVKAGNGGAAGLGTFGSNPLSGGAAGTEVTHDGAPGGGHGGQGGNAGISTNGSNGPSIGILVSGAAPTFDGNTSATFGVGGPAIADRLYIDPYFGHRIPGTPAGVTASVKTL